MEVGPMYQSLFSLSLQRDVYPVNGHLSGWGLR
jgi:hypothetical protein